jgi:hypothetical protein
VSAHWRSASQDVARDLGSATRNCPRCAGQPRTIIPRYSTKTSTYATPSGCGPEFLDAPRKSACVESRATSHRICTIGASLVRRCSCRLRDLFEAHRTWASSPTGACRDWGLTHRTRSRKTRCPGWLDHILNGVEHANFFEHRATEYAKGALMGSWADVWAQAPALQEAGVSA